MTRFFHHWCWLGFFASVLLQPPSFGAEDTAVSDVDPQCKEAAQRVWLLFEAVLDNHVTPPARQQMLLNASRDLWSRTYKGEDADRQLARNISALSQQSAIEDFLATQFSSARQAGKLSIEQIESKAIESALQTIPGGANYISAKEFAVQQQILANRYVGIGIALRKDLNADHPTLNEVFPRGPAHRSGAKNNDLMTKIDGVDTTGMSLQEVVAKLRGQAGISVSIEVRQPDSQETRTLTIVRGEVPLDTVIGRQRLPDQEWDFSILSAKEIAYLKINAIRASTVGELREVTRKLQSQGFRAIILDLRETDDGELRHAAMISDVLLDQVAIGSAVVRGRREEFTSNAENILPSWPMAVVIDQTTVGQAEWIAASLQQRPNTIFVGMNTPGLGYVTEHVRLADGAAIEMRTGVLHRHNGRSLVTPSADNPYAIARRLSRQSTPHRGSRVAVRPPADWNGIAPDLVVSEDPIQSAADKLLEQLAKPVEAASQSCRISAGS